MTPAQNGYLAHGEFVIEQIAAAGSFVKQQEAFGVRTDDYEAT